MKTQLKLSLLSITLCGLVACGSSGGSGGTPSPTPNQATEITPSNNSHTVSVPQNIDQQIKEQKTFSMYTYEVMDKPTHSTQFILLNTDFGTREIELDNFPRYQLVKENYTDKYLTADNETQGESGYIQVYNQTYSGIIGEESLYTITKFGKSLASGDNYQVYDIIGVHSTQEQLPHNQATYKGIAFDKEKVGNITYHVDFANKTGNGEITGLEKYGKITLNQGSISALTNEDKEWQVYKDKNLGIRASASSEKNTAVDGYDLLFFGPNAEEINGFVKEKDDSLMPDYRDYKIGFGATKQ